MQIYKSIYKEIWDAKEDVIVYNLILIPETRMVGQFLELDDSFHGFGSWELNESHNIWELVPYDQIPSRLKDKIQAWWFLELAK